MEPPIMNLNHEPRHVEPLIRPTCVHHPRYPHQIFLYKSRILLNNQPPFYFEHKKPCTWNLIEWFVFNLSRLYCFIGMLFFFSFFFLNQRKREGTCSFFIPKEWLKVPNNALIAIDGRPFNCQGHYMPITPTPLNHFMLHGVEANGWPT